MAPQDNTSAKIEIYKLFVESAERNVERRMRINQFYFSVVTALFIAYSYLAERKFSPFARALEEASAAKSAGNVAILSVHLWLLPLVLVIVSMSWFSVLLSFRALSRAKYDVIGNIEKELPLQPFSAEWRQYKQLRRVEITQLEVALPIIFYFAGIAGVVAPFVL
jgi:hypothetical protein